MLTDKERSEIRKEAARYPHRQAACVAALKIVQKDRGWISGELPEVADLLEMTPDELEGVATFFSHIYLKPLGKHVIFICDSISCWVSGYELLREHLRDRLGVKPGETTGDGRFTLMLIDCLGLCEYAPVMMVDEELYTKVDKAKIDAILEKYR